MGAANPTTPCSALPQHNNNTVTSRPNANLGCRVGGITTTASVTPVIVIFAQLEFTRQLCNSICKVCFSHLAKDRDFFLSFNIFFSARLIISHVQWMAGAKFGVLLVSPGELPLPQCLPYSGGEDVRREERGQTRRKSSF